MHMPLTAAQAKAKARSNVWPAVLVFLVALVVRFAAGGTLPLLSDEAWHLLAGHSWIHEGTLRVDQGAYTRAGYYTILVAWFMDAFGETLAVARLPGVIAGAALVLAVFEWLRRQSGLIAGWIGALLVCFHDLSILLSAEVRFYTLHALCLWLTAAIVYQVAEGDSGRRQSVWMLAVAAALSAVALLVQATAGVALAAIVLWAVCDLAYRFRTCLWAAVRSHWILAAVSAVVLLGGAVSIFLHPPAALAGLYAEFRHTAYWAQPRQDWMLFYERYYSETITLLWGLFPPAFAAAFIHRPRAAVYCAFLFIVPTLIMSFGGMKAGRYVFFALPYLFATWGLAADAVSAKAVQSGYQAWDQICNLIVGSRHNQAAEEGRWRRYGFAIAAVVVLAFAVFSQVSYRESAKLIVKSARTALSQPAQILTGPPFEPWAGHRNELMRMIERASIFITAKPTTTLLALRPADVVLTRNLLDDEFTPSESSDESEFVIDRRVGRPVVGTTGSLQAIMDCYQTGIVIVPDAYWRNRAAVTEEVANLLMVTAKLTRMTAPNAPEELLVFEWESAPPSSTAACGELGRKLSLNP